MTVMNKEVIITRGLPASGKSFWARQQQELYPGKYKVVCKDDLRSMMDDGRYTSKNESFIIKVRNDLILKFLDAGYSVIVSDTNLNPSHELDIRKLVDDKVQVKIQDFTNVPLEVCIERDLKRMASVGESVIRSMYMKFLHEYPKFDRNIKLPKAILCDLDGTLAHHIDRDPYDFHRAGEDAVCEPVQGIARRYLDTHKVIFMSGRDDSSYEITKNWIIYKASLPCEFLFMRKTGDQRKDSIVKRELYDLNVKDKYNVEFVLDDRSQVVDMWRSLGLTTLQCQYGDF